MALIQDYVLWGIAVAPSVLFFLVSTAAFAAVAALFGANDETAIVIGGVFTLFALPILVGLAGWGIGALFGITVALVFGAVIALLISGFGGWVLWALRHEEV